MSSVQFGRKESFNLKIKTKWDCPGSPEVKTVFPMQEAQVWSLVKELRYHIPYAAGVPKIKKIKTKTFSWLMHSHRNTCQVRNIFSLSTICAYEQYLCGSGEGNGTPLQYSCLENPMNGGAWWAAVHGVTTSRTRLSDFAFTFHFHALEKEMATHSNVRAWRIPGTGGGAGGLPSMGSHRVRHDWSDLAAAVISKKNISG